MPQLNDQLAELQQDLEYLRRGLESESLRHVDAMRQHNEELRGLKSRIERIRGTIEGKVT